MTTLADRVIERRKALSLTQKELASRVTKAGFPLGQSAISSIEKKGDSHPQCIYELAIALEVGVEWLQTGKGPMSTYGGFTDSIIRGSKSDNVAEVPGLLKEYTKRFGRADSTADERSLDTMRAPVDFPRLPKDVPIFPSWATTLTLPDVGFDISHRTDDINTLPTAVMNDRPRGFAQRLPAIASRDDVFCTVVTDGLMHPWRTQTEPIYVERLRPPHMGSHALIVLQESPDPTNLQGHRDPRTEALGTIYEITIGQIIGGGSDRLTFKRYAPPTTFHLHKNSIRAMWRIIEWRELMTEIPIE